MKFPLLILSSVLLAASLPAAPAAPASDELGTLFPAQADEAVVIPQLKAVILLAQPPAPGAASAPAAAAGVDASQVPLLANDAFTRALTPFLGQPASVPSLDRLQRVIRVHLQLLGRPFANIWIPPQDVTDGAVRVVVQPAALEAGIDIAGNRWFSRASYIGALRLQAGAPLDTRALDADLAWLNRNPFRQVRPVVEAGSQPGTSRVTLRTEERFPLMLNAGYDNTGTPNTDEDRVSAGLTWGNAFGRGDQLYYRFSADPRLDYLRSHSAGYTAYLPWRHVLSLQAAFTDIDTAVPPPFEQSGRSWQVGARYDVPLRATRAGWAQSLNFTADFKYSDNTLEFSTMPVTNNLTHTAQAGASYGLNFPALGGNNDARAEVVVSPGNLTRYNDDEAFAGSRPGAKATYAYARLGLRHLHPLPAGFSLNLSADTQFSTGALLGTEQLNGGGTAAVRGYRESSAFGDWGVVGSAELHAPAFSPVKGRDRLDAFVFLDAASLQLHVDRNGTDLASAGLGVNYQFGRHFNLRAAYGWQLKAIDTSAGVYSGHGHIGAGLTW